MIATRRLLGLDLADCDAAQAAAWIAARPQQAPFGYVVTPNADHFVRLARDPALAAIYRAAALRLLDSRVVAAAAGLLGLDPPRVAAGADVVAILLARHVAAGERLTILGLDPRDMPALMEATGIAAPAHYDPPRGFAADPGGIAACADFAAAHPARLTLIALGSPQQERVAAAIAARAGMRGTALCIGAGLDFLAGRVARAPRWMRAGGMEWLFRLLQEPRRLAPRYLRDDPAVFALLLRAALTGR